MSTVVETSRPYKNVDCKRSLHSRSLRSLSVEMTKRFNIVISSGVSIANVIEKSRPFELSCRLHVVWKTRSFGAETSQPFNIVMSTVVETSQPYKTKKRHIKGIVFYLSFKSFIFQMYYLSFSPQLGQVLFSALILPPQLGQKLAVFLTLIGVTSSSSSSSSSAYPIK